MSVVYECRRERGVGEREIEVQDEDGIKYLDRLSIFRVSSKCTYTYTHTHILKMSFGRPGGALDSFRVLPPDRGSFPLDHDGEFFRHPS